MARRRHSPLLIFAALLKIDKRDIRYFSAVHVAQNEINNNNKTNNNNNIFQNFFL